MWWMLLIACSSPPQLRSVSGEAMGTTWTVKWMGDADPGAAEAIAESLSAVDQAMSTWRKDSEISQVRSTVGAVPVSGRTAMVTRDAIDMARMSGGAFDPTVQPLVELWGFHGQPRKTLPTEEELARARSQVGWERVKVTVEGGEWSINGGGTALDLSAIAKGHAVDEVSATVSARGHKNHMVEIGGEVRALGEGQGGQGWRIGIDRPDAASEPGASVEAVVVLRDMSLATSGNYRTAYVVEGQTLGHTIDPRTGRPVLHDVVSATVLARDCRTADALATTAMVDPELGLTLIEKRAGAEGLLLVRTGDTYEKRMTTGMAKHLAEGGR